MIFSLTYRSRSLIPAASVPAELDRIVEAARASNATRGITGALLFDGVRFVQVLEGERGDVEWLMKRIAGDRRHAEVEVLLREFRSERQFRDWAMAFVGDGGTDVQAIMRDLPVTEPAAVRRLAVGMAAAAA